MFIRSICSGNYVLPLMSCENYVFSQFGLNSALIKHILANQGASLNFNQTSHL